MSLLPGYKLSDGTYLQDLVDGLIDAIKANPDQRYSIMDDMIVILCSEKIENIRVLAEAVNTVSFATGISGINPLRLKNFNMFHKQYGKQFKQLKAEMDELRS